MVATYSVTVVSQLHEYGRPEPPLAADETETLLGFLDFQRTTPAWKCSGLDAAALRATVASSTMTLGGLLKHMALVEDSWFSRSLHGQERRAPWDTVDWQPIGNGITTRLTSCGRCGRPRWTVPALSSERRSQAVAAATRSGCWLSVAGPTGGRPSLR